VREIVSYIGLPMRFFRDIPINPIALASRPLNRFNLPVGGVALEIDHVVRYRGDVRRRVRRGDGDSGCRGGRDGDGGGDSGGLRLAGAVMRLLAALRGGPRGRGWAAPRPAFRKESVQVGVLQDQTCHRHGAFMSRRRMPILRI